MKPVLSRATFARRWAPIYRLGEPRHDAAVEACLMFIQYVIRTFQESFWNSELSHSRLKTEFGADKLSR